MSARRLAISCILVLVCGCASSHSGAGQGLRVPAPERVENWAFEGTPARKLVTPHYVIYTTLADDEVIAGIGQVMEGALSQYRRLAPQVPASGQPMACYLFQTRAQWAAFTRT